MRGIIEARIKELEAALARRHSERETGELIGLRWILKQIIERGEDE